MATDHKTGPTADDVSVVVANIEDPRRRGEAETVLSLMAELTQADPVVWGPSMIGFGRQPYTTADGKQHEWFAIGLAPRKTALTLYGLTYYGSNADLLERLGKHTTGKGCLYIKRLDQVDSGVLGELIERAWATNHTPAEDR